MDVEAVLLGATLFGFYLQGEKVTIGFALQAGTKGGAGVRGGFVSCQPLQTSRHATPAHLMRNSVRRM
jgi:hypothetical protein